MSLVKLFFSCLRGVIFFSCIPTVYAEVTLVQQINYTDRALNIKLPAQHFNVALYNGKLVSSSVELPQYITVYDTKARSITGIWRNSRMWHRATIPSLGKSEELNPHWLKTARTSKIAGYQCQWYEANTSSERHQACLVSATTLFDPEDAKTIGSVGLISQANSVRDQDGASKPTFISPPKGFFALETKGQGGYGEFSSKITNIVKGTGKSAVLGKSVIPPGFVEFRR